jgi:hypothetical protein
LATTNIFRNGNFGYQVSANQVDFVTKIRVSKVPSKHGNWVSAFDMVFPLPNQVKWKTSQLLMVLAEMSASICLFIVHGGTDGYVRLSTAVLQSDQRCK